MRAVITVIGQDRVGILARVSQACAKVDANILDVTQSVLQDIFVMVMLVDIQNLKEEFGSFADTMKELGKDWGLAIHVMHEDIFNSMHRI